MLVPKIKLCIIAQFSTWACHVISAVSSWSCWLKNIA